MKKIILSILMVSFLHVFANEDKGTTYRVLDKNDSYITGAKVTVKGEKEIVLYSDLDGQFTVPKEIGEQYVLKVEMVSFKDMVKEIDMSTPHSKSIELVSN
ncbi:MAG: hypothetical protein CMO34_04670 [Verrucomicrobia bacterium]|nr:hypothetical protein [Verrucomicrobiota bacterium]|tara:strand:- start:847 stop:1149 length:303 start_codon:yes stop_codon:yes gene_type:complete